MLLRNSLATAREQPKSAGMGETEQHHFFRVAVAAMQRSRGWAGGRDG